MKAFRPPVVMSGAAGIVLLALGRTSQAAVLLALTVIQITGPLVAPVTSDRVGRWVGAVGHRAAHAFSFVVWLPVGAGFVVAWALAPLLRIHPLDQPRGWLERSGDDDQRMPAAGAPWAHHHQQPLTGAPRWARFGRRVLGAAIMAGLLLATFEAGPWRRPTSAPLPGHVATGPRPIEPPLALRTQADSGQVREEEGALFAQMEADPVTGWRLPESFTGDEINVTNHRRASVQASDVGPVVWFFGGSTMFGSNQSDDHTIASEFARIATADDQPVQVVNFGVHAYTAYQEAELLQQAVDQHGAPDLVIFYDGYNDMTVAIGTSFLGAPAGVPQRAPSLAQGDGAAPTTTAPIGVPPWRTPAERYASAAAIQEAAAALARKAVGPDVPVLHFWQPTAYTRTPTAKEREQLASVGLDDEAIETYQAVSDGVRARLPQDFIDLTDSLDGAPTVFVDQVHTNELGARLVAHAMYEAARPRLQQIS